MCGIVGIWGEANRAVITDMLQAVRHRGPDTFEVLVTDRHSFGAALLRLVSVERDSQPHAPGDLILLFNGEIYNYQELRTEHAPELPPEASEIEVVTALYRKMGEDLIPLLKGMFALAIADGEKLILARDRFGIKPLFYCRAGHSFLFASEMKALLRHPLVSPRLNLRALDETVVFGFMCSPGITPLQGIEQVCPGTIVTIDEGVITKRRYSAIAPARFAEEGDISLAEAADEIRVLLSRAVSQLVKHGQDRKGFFLSGGIDSSTLTGLALEETGLAPLTFTLYESEDSWDLPSARQAAKAYGSELVEFRVTLEDYLNEIPHYVYHFENLICGGIFDVHGGIAFHMLCRRVASYVRIAFSGEGADELFGGYYWSYLYPLGLSDRIRNRIDAVAADKARPLVESVFPQPEDERTYTLNLYDLLMSSGLSNYHLCSADRSSSAFGFELRPAYLYDDLARFALSLPVEYKTADQQTKRGLREAVRPLLTKYGLSEVISRRKFGMPAATDEIGKAAKRLASEIVAAGRIKLEPPLPRLTNPFEMLMLDLYRRVFIDNGGRLPADFNLREFYKVGRVKE